jgi:uncharacterized protein YgbK (DUF1537 family)
MKKLLLTFYGDDFTGSTDALEQLANFGIRAMLFIEPPTRSQLKQFRELQAVGVAGMTRSMTPDAMESELRPAFKKLKALGAPHVHYKVCSTFDSSPNIGSIGRAMDVGMDVFNPPFIPLLVAAPALGRYTVFGIHFARFGIGSNGAIHRIDRHPSISRHPVTPMTEADLRLHLAGQTRKKVALFDISNVALPENAARGALKETLRSKPDVILFDALNAEQLPRIGALIDRYANSQRPLFSVGSSGIEMALGTHWAKPRLSLLPAKPVKQLLVGSGSCSPVTGKQIAWALRNGFAEIALDVAALASRRKSSTEIKRATTAAANFFRAGRSVIVHTTKSVSSKRTAAKLKNNTANILGTALGRVLLGVLVQTRVERLCIAGGDTSSYAARALGIKAVRMIAPLTPGAPLCQAFAAGSPADGLEVVFKGGQVGAENYFKTVRRGRV